MTPLYDYVTGLGATIRPHPATEPALGSAGLVVVASDDTWHDIDALEGAPPRTDTTAVVLVAPGLARAGFVPNVVATASIIAPAVPAAALLDAVVACMEGAEDWRVRARSVTGAGGRGEAGVGDRARGGADGRAGDGDDDEDLVLDLLGEYRLGGTGLALSTLARARTAGGVTVLHQTHVTTLADQIHHHRSGLAAAVFA
ncbi:hypothetical protein AYJ66_11820 [Dietzia cinnamea]|uniref:hypothetical protein n=1 Tax=Dietzia massiliensis TaxID=2697499 RepID=UPI0007C84529|nr:hypothetical protein [Dietzia massiliensis]MBS7549564.1 hypothetical protein [Dietzia massiliensis]OAH63535.1 hypothetical protein AYJ66_11820 [Dietzia cinnamea]